MTLYLDTSHLVKLYIDEADSDHVRAQVAKADVVAVSSLAYPEARATFARKRREHLMTLAEHGAAVRQLDADWPRMLVVAYRDDLIASAGQLADKHNVRGADAVHLASLEVLIGRSQDDEVEFSCADDRLVKAANQLG
jgi:predicted nucleic acid-binding protein